MTPEPTNKRTDPVLASSVGAAPSGREEHADRLANQIAAMEQASKLHAHDWRVLRQLIAESITSPALPRPEEARASGVSEGWQPMATAPLNGTHVIVVIGDVVGEAYYYQGESGSSDTGWWWAQEGPGDYHAEKATFRRSEPTHWMPLPAAPARPVQGEGR